MADFRVLVTDQVFPDVEVERELLGSAGGVLDVAHGSKHEVLAAARDADALLNTYLPVDASDMEALSRCKIIARYGIGVDNIDLNAAQRAGIAVTNVPDYCVEEVATHTLGLMLALVRAIPFGDSIVRQGGWGISQLPELRRLSELTVGLLGYGRIAQRVAGALRVFGADVIVHDPYLDPPPPGERMVRLEEVLTRADVVSVHCPLTAGTRGLLDRERLAMMRQDALLINTSRGPIVVFDDLADALREGRLAGAALDVFPTEPPVAEELAGVPNLLATPHSAFYSRAAIRESQRKATTQVIKAIHGAELDYQVN